MFSQTAETISTRHTKYEPRYLHAPFSPCPKIANAAAAHQIVGQKDPQKSAPPPRQKTTPVHLKKPLPPPVHLTFGEKQFHQRVLSPPKECYIMLSPNRSLAYL